MKTKHYYGFEPDVSSRFYGDSLNSDNWDVLRTDDRESPFAIEKNMEIYEKNCMASARDKDAVQRVCQLLEDVEVNKVISLGAGKAILEWHLKKMKPELAVECTDYTEKAIERLKNVFKDMDSSYRFDMLNGNYSELDINAVFLMNRVSTEFSIDEWYRIFESMHGAGILYIIFIPTGLDNCWSMLKEKLFFLLNILRRRRNICCGWLYSENEYLRMFSMGGYSIEKRLEFDGTAAFLLKRC